jgi:eukaryotic-like serine/threonine-protein kinase
MSRQTSPHKLLSGMSLQNGWRVLEKTARPDEGTGGFFSCGYLVERVDGQRGYLKALDFFSRLPVSDDPARALEPLLKAFNFERDLLKKCHDRRLSRVITALDDGAVTVPGVPPPSTVQYIIFELAEGDVRSQMDRIDELDISWALRSLHHMAVGLAQLHSINVAHQDLKPSNVLLFGARTSSKLADLGRAAEKGVDTPHYDVTVAGDWSYAPPELLYGASPVSWDARRMGCDAYLLGSMIASLFTTVAMTPLVMMGLEQRFHWSNWTGSYDEVLPYLRAAHAEAVRYVSGEFPSEYKSELTDVLEQLCDPDPSLRGHPRNRQSRFGDPYSLERYVSAFNLLACRAELRLRRR